MTKHRAYDIVHICLGMDWLAPLLSKGKRDISLANRVFMGTLLNAWFLMAPALSVCANERIIGVQKNGARQTLRKFWSSPGATVCAIPRLAIKPVKNIGRLILKKYVSVIEKMLDAFVPLTLSRLANGRSLLGSAKKHAWKILQDVHVLRCARSAKSFMDESFSITVTAAGIFEVGFVTGATKSLGLSRIPQICCLDWQVI